jgi:hypothetical protein
MEKELAVPDSLNAVNEAPIMPFSTRGNFDIAWRMASALSRSTIVPKDYQGESGIANCVVALEMSQRLGISPMLVMQNLYVIQGRPSWSASYLIGSINRSGLFSPLRYKFEDRGVKDVEYTYSVGYGKDRTTKTGVVKGVRDTACRAWAKEKETGEVVEGPEVTMEMAIKEGWYTKDGSKWKTMPETMIRYRAAAFFCRMYCPEIAMGLHTADEVEDFSPVTVTAVPSGESLKDLIGNTAKTEITDASFTDVQPSAETAEPKDPEPQPSLQAKGAVWQEYLGVCGNKTHAMNAIKKITSGRGSNEWTASDMKAMREDLDRRKGEREKPAAETKPAEAAAVEEPPFFAAQGTPADAKEKTAEETAFDFGSASEDAAAKPAEILF